MLIYCDCEDLASKCKHLCRIRMIIERHMSSLCGSLPFIDHATEMRTGDITETKVELEAEPIDMESWKSQLQITKEDVQWF